MQQKISWRKILFYRLLVLFLLFGVPILINEAYNIGGYKTNWTASDALLFYGAVLGGFATLLAIMITIRNEKKKREYFELKQKNDLKLQQIRVSLSQALQALDVTHMVLIEILPKDPSPALGKLDQLSLEVRRITSIDILFDAEQKLILTETAKKLANYAEQYYNLIRELSKVSCGYYDYNLYLSSTKLLDSYMRNPDEFRKEIKELEEDIAGLNSADFKAVADNITGVRMKIVELNNESYNDIYDSVMNGIKALEHYYEQQQELLSNNK